jgi:tetratricopeptide (TPR) repeat protein
MKHLSLLALLILVTFFAGSQASADNENGVMFEIIIRQKPEIIDKYSEIDRDTIEVVIGKGLYTFLVNTSLDIMVEEIDSQSVTFTCHLSTIGRNPYIFSERYRIELNLPARIDNIPGKHASVYQLLISPRKFVDIDSALCPHDPGPGGHFNMDPTANFDLYYVKNSLGDFHWNNIKNYLETDYRQFRDALDINIPGKISFYLCPCPAQTISWDERFGYSIDPGRANIYAIYSHDYVSVDALLPNLLTLLRLYGYAPPFLSEGLAGYFDFVPYQIKQLKSLGKIPPLKSILTTSNYMTADPAVAEVTAASFVKYLADGFGIGDVLALYEQSDDLNILKNIESMYGAELDSLEKSWLNYVDTFQLNRRVFDYYAGRANALYRPELQIEYLEEMRNYDESRYDSTDTWKKLSTTYYQYGYYYKALDGFQLLLQIDSSRAIYWQIIGNLYLINGEYDSAWAAFDSVYAVDSTYAASKLLQAKILAIRGDTASAIKLAEEHYGREASPAGKIEFLLFLGGLYQDEGEHHDAEKAERYFSDAAVWSADMMAKVPDDPTFKLRAGLANLGLGLYDEARTFLDIAHFTEIRSYQLGRILLALGNLYDVLGDHEKAVPYYRECLANQSSAHHRELAVKYIEKPYTIQ